MNLFFPALYVLRFLSVGPLVQIEPGTNDAPVHFTFEPLDQVGDVKVLSLLEKGIVFRIIVSVPQVPEDRHEASSEELQNVREQIRVGIDEGATVVFPKRFPVECFEESGFPQSVLEGFEVRTANVQLYYFRHRWNFCGVLWGIDQVLKVDVVDGRSCGG